MADVKWTKAQQTAIDTRQRTMLLSAAAGSGKTAVLTERVIQAITDPTHPLDLSRLLAVTFTKAAASQMKKKIGDALQKAIQADPNNLNLKYQLQILPFVTIKTIDSFCGILLKKYASESGVPDGFRTMDTEESSLLEMETMKDVVENAFTGVLPNVEREDFEGLVKNLVGIRSQEQLPELLLSLYTKLNTTKEGISLLLRFDEILKEESEKGTQHSNYYALWKKSLNEPIEILYQQLQEELRNNLFPIYPELSDSKSYFSLTLSCSYDALLSFDSESLKQIKKSFPSINKNNSFNHKDEECIKKAKSISDSIRKAVSQKIDKVGDYSELDWKQFLVASAKSCKILFDVLSFYEKQFNELCFQKNALNFAQIERFTYNLLMNEGKRTEQAIAISHEYDMICVDEYQDVNPLQHALFEAISTPTNRFLVGDIKQSIYRFRHADPSIFASLRNSYPDIQSVGDGFIPVSHFMSNNFRSDKGIIDYANSLFSLLFGAAGDSIAYDAQSDNLVFTKQPQATPIEKPEIYYLTYSKRKPEENSDEESEEESLKEERSDSSEEPQDKIEFEAEFIANKIYQLISDPSIKCSDGVTPITPDKIAILRRSLVGATIPFGTALLKYNIHLENKEGKAFFADPEVLLAVSLLNTISNPRKDIYLAATLCSPIYHFTSDDLLEIRKGHSKQEPLFDDLLSYTKKHVDFKKGQEFLKSLERYQKLCENIPVWKLLEMIYKETPLMTIAGLNEKGGENNLKLLYTYAREYQGAEFGGLFGFLNFINQESEKSEDTFSAPGKIKSGSAVQLMSIHKSKGLEFPVVILSGCSKKFNTKDLNETILLENNLGIAHDFRSKNGERVVKNPIKDVLSYQIHQDDLEEELRILYVAVTRAQERFIVVGTETKAWMDKEETLKNFFLYPQKASLFTYKSMFDWILLGYLSNQDTSIFYLNPEMIKYDVKQDENRDISDIKAYKSRISEYFSYIYPHDKATKIANKYSVSTLKDAVEELTKPGEHEKKYRSSLRLPKAYSHEVETSASQRGTATHKFLEFCNFHHLLQEGFNSELERQLQLKIFTQDTVSLLRTKELENFAKSSLLQRICQAKFLEREFRFTLYIPFSEIVSEEEYPGVSNEKVFIQGVIDLLIENQDGSYTLVDYKTDRLSKEELQDKELAAKKLLPAHEKQVTFYARAVEEMYGTRPKEMFLYSLPLADTIEVPMK